MKKILVLLALLGVVNWYLFSREAGSAGPLQISDPVYSETRTTMPRGSEQIEMVLLMKTASQNDCSTRVRELERQISRNPELCPGCSKPISKCLTSLPPRFANMFANKAGHLTYLAMSADGADEREARAVYYGTTDADGDMLCQLVDSYQQSRKGKVSCVRARRD